MPIGLYGPERLQYQSGGPAREQQVFVFMPDTTIKATLYADPSGLSTAANPLWTDYLGELTFWAQLGDYDLVINGVRVRVTVTTPVMPEGGGVTPIDLRLATRFRFEQVNPSAVWLIVHPLGYEPAGVRVIESLGLELYGAVRYPTVDSVEISFGQPCSGVAYLS